MLTGAITVATVFQAGLLLDMHRILQDRVQLPYEYLRRQGSESEVALGIKWKRAVSGK